MRDSLQIPFKTKTITLYFEEFEDDIDMDDLTKIDYTNLFAEIITIPSIMNRVGLWKALADNKYANYKLDVAIYKSKLGQTARGSYKQSINSKQETVNKEKTVADVADEVMTDKRLKIKLKKLNRLQMEADFMDSLYWAIKSKETKLNKIGEKMNLSPEEFEKQLVTGKWNGILIKSKKNLID